MIDMIECSMRPELCQYYFGVLRLLFMSSVIILAYVLILDGATMIGEKKIKKKMRDK